MVKPISVETVKDFLIRVKQRKINAGYVKREIEREIESETKSDANQHRLNCVLPVSEVE